MKHVSQNCSDFVWNDLGRIGINIQFSFDSSWGIPAWPVSAMQTLLWRKSGVLSIAFSRKMSDEDSIFACFEPERGSHQSLDVLLDIQQPGLAFSSWKPRKHFLSRVCKFTWVEPARYPPSIHQVTLDLANRIEGVCKKKTKRRLSSLWILGWSLWSVKKSKTCWRNFNCANPGLI